MAGVVRFDFSNTNFVITGASSGIGRRLVCDLAEAGANVLALARRETPLRELSQQFPGKVLAIPTDVTDQAAMEASIAVFVSEFGKVDGSVHAAGILQFTPLRLFDVAQAKAMMDINYWAGIFLLQVATKKKYSNDGASHVQIASVSARCGERGLSVYGASKAALQSSARAFVQEVAERRHRINTISPGLLKTEMTDGRLDMKSGNGHVCLGEGKISDVTTTAMFLLSDGARWISGADFVVDGGYLA